MLPIGWFRIEDDSMRPTLAPGDYVFVNRWAYRVRPPEKGDLIVLRDPEGGARFLAKRVRDVNSGGIEVRGDNEARSRDSRAFGPVDPMHIVGKVWFRLGR